MSVRGPVVQPAQVNVSIFSDAKTEGKRFFKIMANLIGQLADDKQLGIRIGSDFFPDKNSVAAQFRVNQEITDQRNRAEGFIRLVGIVRDLNQRAFRLGG